MTNSISMADTVECLGMGQLCDVISKWETALREKGLGKFQNTKVIRMTYRHRLYWRNSLKVLFASHFLTFVVDKPTVYVRVCSWTDARVEFLMDVVCWWW